MTPVHPATPAAIVNPPKPEPHNSNSLKLCIRNGKTGQWDTKEPVTGSKLQCEILGVSRNIFRHVQQWCKEKS